MNKRTLFTDFKFSPWFILYSAGGSLNNLDVDSVSDVSEVHIVPTFRPEVSKVSQCPCIYRIFSNGYNAEKLGTGVQPGPMLTVQTVKFIIL
jgi:hypothetical protein